jgi:hypothetical protein
MGSTVLGNAVATQCLAAGLPVVQLNITAPAAAIAIGDPTVISTTGVAVAGAANFQLGQGGATFNLKEVYFVGTNAQVVRWVAITR